MQSLLNKQKILETLLDSFTCKIGCNTVTNSSKKMLSHLTLQVLVYSALSVFTCQTSNLLMDYIAILKHSTRVFFYSPAIEQSQVIEACTETEVVNNNSGIEIGK